MSAVRVKICGITRPADLQAALAAGVDALGFVFAPRSSRVLSTESAAELADSVPAFVARVGLFMDQDSGQVEQVLKRVRLNVLQFHGSEGASFCQGFGLPYVKAVSMQSERSLREAEAQHSGAAGLLLDSHAPGAVGGTGRVFDWDMVRDCRRPLILAGGLTPDNVRAAVATLRPWAVDVSSGVEDAPGIKNAEKMCKFIREAKS